MLIGCTLGPDTPEGPVITLPRISGKAPLRYEQIYVRAAFLAKGSYRGLSGIACEIKGQNIPIKFSAPQKFNVPVYAGRLPSYTIICQMELGASMRFVEGKIEPRTSETIATADSASAYEPNNYVYFSNMNTAHRHKAP